jgi:uncharacterized protein YcaQ
MPNPMSSLRAQAVARSLRRSETIADAIAALRFVQLDPIRAPARAADLILRQRVPGYRAGDLERAYPSLPLAEDYLHVYGVMPTGTRDLLHPRSARLRFRAEREHPRLAARVLAHVAANGETHPRDLAHLGVQRTTSGWGNDSAATTRILEALHLRGLLRVARRVNGIKVYAPGAAAVEPRPAGERARDLLLLLLDLYAPLPERSFRELARMVTEVSVSPALRARTLARLERDPAVERVKVDGVAWLRPADEAAGADVEARVRFLAPFDPIVWDRRRFEQLWGWDYRFEAYTPPKLRRFGYYALPLLWRDDVIGWANASAIDDGLAIEVGYVRRAPGAAAFRRELDAEAERLRHFLGASRVTLR